MSAKRHLTERDIRSAIFRLSNRLRQNRSLIYDFDAATRVLLMQVMVDPEKSFRKLMDWAKTTEDLPTWESVLRLARENDVDLVEFCKLQKWDIAALETLYGELRHLKSEVKSGA